MSVKADLICFNADEPMGADHVHRYVSTRRFLVAWTMAAHDGGPVVRADSDSLAIIAPTLVHTTEGVGPGSHILIDIFAPPRRDFIAKGQILNAVDYVDSLT
jgi:hypothetical protein